jgi:hypothetical protein
MAAITKIACLILTMTSFFSDVTRGHITSQKFVAVPSVAGLLFSDHVKSIITSRSIAHCSVHCSQKASPMFTYTHLSEASADNCRCHSKVMTSYNTHVTPRQKTKAYAVSVTYGEDIKPILRCSKRRS